MRLLALVALLAAPRALALERWTPMDTGLELSFAVLASVDMLQTHSITDDPKRVEINPFLGKKPEHATINGYFAGMMVGHAVVARLLPQPYRRIWQVFFVGVEAQQVWRNDRVGVGLAFSW